MIRIKILYEYDYDSWRNCEFYDNKYSFMDLVNTYNFLSEDAPFRDDESRMFIEEIDNAEFSSKYGVVTPYGECPVTSLSGGTRYALTVIHNSRMGDYTSFEPYGEDIWDRLANLPFDVLIFVKCDEIQISHMSAVKRCLIENYRDEKGNISEKLIDNPEDCYTAWNNLSFHLKRDFEKIVIRYAIEKITCHRIFEYPPLIYNSFKEFGDFIDDIDDPHDCFHDVEYDDIDMEDYKPSLMYPDVKICSYLTEMISIINRNPVMIMIERCQETKTYTVKEVYPIMRYPSFSAIIMLTGDYDDNDERINVLDKFGNWDKMILVSDYYKQDNSKKWLDNICLCEKLEGKTMSLYNGRRIWYELLKFINGYTINFKKDELE